MFNPWRQYLSVAVAAVLPMLAALWAAILSKHDPPTYQRVLYVSIIGLVSGSAAYFTQIKPAANLQKPVLTLLTVLATGPIALGSTLGITLRMNLMVVSTPWYLFGSKRLSVVWGLGMNGFPDVRFRCTVNQGVAGIAYRTRRPAIVDLTTVNPAIFGFTAAQIADTAHLNTVRSWPVEEYNKQGIPTGRIVGIVNLDALQPGSSAILVANSTAFDKFLKDFADVASSIL